jgi:hypothetical protein
MVGTPTPGEALERVMRVDPAGFTGGPKSRCRRGRIESI